MIINFVALDKLDYLYNYKNIKCFPLDKLANQKYIFPIPIHNTGTDSGYFVTHEQTGFGALGDTIAKDVKNNRAKIVLIFPLEGFVGSTPGRLYLDFQRQRPETASLYLRDPNTADQDHSWY
jgi:hypothetical protein